MPNSNCNILIIEDEMLIARSIKKMIEKHFNCIGIAKNYEEAITFLNVSDVDLALIDITLTGNKTGIDVAHYITENNKILFIFLTALTDTETLQNIVNAKPNAYLAKPIQEANLVTAINLALLNKKENTMTLEIGKQNHIINLNDFLYAQSDRVYITLHFKNNSPLLLRTSFTYLETKFPETHFKRINRSDAINPKCITTKTTTTIIIADKTFKISEKF
jgi:DNA-binding LytR/AlgR family response regulator